ncbi:MAG: hypothetical protein R2854_01735 [Caldilineaceae bacterium]
MTPTPTDTATPTGTPTATLTPTPTPTPIDVAKVVYESLPPVFVEAAVVLALAILGAGISIIRGPKDIQPCRAWTHCAPCWPRWR